jgi:hypothetical protein
VSLEQMQNPGVLHQRKASFHWLVDWWTAQRCFPGLQWKETSKSAPTRMNQIADVRNKADEKMGNSQMQSENCDIKDIKTSSDTIRSSVNLPSKSSRENMTSL